MAGLWWEEFKEGRAWRTEPRTVNVNDLDRFTELSGDRNLLHVDDDYARAAGYEGRIAHGALGIALATGLINRLGLTSGTLVALLGMTWNFLKPVYPGMTVHVDLAMRSAVGTQRSERGMVVLSAALADANGTVYQRGELTMLVRKRGSDAGAT